MEEDQNFLKVKIKLLIIIFTILFASKSYCEKIVLEKLVELDSPWGSSFISNNEIIVTEKSGKIKNAKHVPRGMLEFWIDPKSPYYRDYFNSKNKFIFYCASGWRSSLSSKTALEMGLINVLNLENGIDDWIKQNGPIEKVNIKKN